jgi:hypothetical protein
VAFHDFNGFGLAVCLALRNGAGGLHGHRGRGEYKDAQISLHRSGASH